MERDYGAEIDDLKKQLEEWRNAVSARLDELQGEQGEVKSETKKLGRVHVMQNMHPDRRLSEQMEELCYKTEDSGMSGLVTYFGLYNSGGRQSNWIRSAVSTDKLLDLMESGIAGKVLSCIGNENRLAILLEILRGPKTVAALVEKCGFGSAGMVYHHMKPFLAADIIAEDAQHKGVYIIQPHKVQGVIMLLAGISDMVDETYTQGAWEE